MRCSIVASVATEAFRYVLEQGDEFLALFPHRFDFIYAEHPEPSQSPHWQTESRYPLSDRLILQGSALYGVRFSSQTRYCLLDIDTGSAYHPQADSFAIGRMMAALEPLGFTAYLACQSSYRGGIHLYLPFQDARSSWDLAACVAALLENAGFKLKPGQLELFPNPKPFSTTKKPTLFNAHRLPMQAGSYLLNQNFETVWSDRSRFVQQWRFVQSCNSVETKVLRQLLKQNKHRHYRISGKADKFLNDLDTEIEQGWTAHGQTNRLLGRIALRTYVFHHVTQGGEPLTGQALIDQIVSIARSLPGYRDWCRHQHEIEHRAAEWASCAENSHYFHYTHRSTAQAPEAKATREQLLSWNQQQSESAREKIRRAIVDLLERDSLPAKTTARFQALLQYGIGGASLYRHRDLWHPEQVESCLAVENDLAVENPPHPPTSLSARPSDQLETSSNGLSCTSLFPSNGGNVSSEEGSSDRSSERILQASQIARREEQYESRLQQYLNSGDPILIAEAKSCQHVQQINSCPVHSTGSQAVHAHDLAQVLPDCVQPSSESENLLSNSIAVHSPFDLFQHSFRNLAKDSFQHSSDDLSDLLVFVSVEIRRLRWKHDQIRDRLLHRYTKPSRAMLTKEELLDWLTWLSSQGVDRTMNQTMSSSEEHQVKQ